MDLEHIRRVLLIDHAPLFGGAESFLLDLADALDPSEWTPIIVTDPSSPVLSRFRASGATVVTTRLPHINKNPLFLWHLISAGRQLARVASDAQADVMHSFTARAHLIASVASRLSGIPLVWRLCDDTLPSWLLMPFASAPSVIVAVSEWIARVYPNLRFDGLAPDGARPSPALSRAAARHDLGLADNDYVVAHIGRLVRWKGQDVFIRAVAKAAERQPNLRALVVGGWQPQDEGRGLLGGGESYYRALETLASDLGLCAGALKRVIFTGFMKEPAAAYAAADVVAHTSIMPEPFGRVVIEAMMADRAVIAADAGALPEIVVNRESGLLTPPGDTEALAQAIVDLGSPDLRAQMAATGRERALRLFTLEQMTRNMERFYRLAIEKHGNDHAHRD